MRESINAGETKITIVGGSEGPRHDPYGYTELTVTRRGHETTLHEGLAYWVKRDGVEVETKDPGWAFKLLVGFSSGEVYRWVERLHSRCRSCGGRWIEGVDGYPGEVLYVCNDCGKVVTSTFNESAVI